MCDLINKGKTIDLQFHGSHNYLVSQVIYYDSVSKAFFKSIKTPHEKSFLSILVCMVSTISRITCWVEWAWRKPYWDEHNRRTTVSGTSGTFSPRNRRNACRNISPPQRQGGPYLYQILQLWIKPNLIPPSCIFSDVSVRDPTLQTSTSEKLERRYPLREHKPPHTFSWSYLNYENCSRHLHALLLVHDVIVVLGFFFCLPLFQEEANPVLCACAVPSMFTTCSGGHTSYACSVLIF